MVVPLKMVEKQSVHVPLNSLVQKTETSSK